MKAKKVVSPKTETEKPGGGKPLIMGKWATARERKEEILSRLGDARLRAQGMSSSAAIDALDWLIHRASSLCDIVGEAAYTGSGSELPGESLAETMDIIREDIQVARWLAEGLHLQLQDCQKSLSEGHAPDGAA